MPDSRSSLPSTHKFATTLPSASNSLEPKNLFLGETFANLGYFWFGWHRRAFDVHLRQYLLGVGGYLRLTLLRCVFWAAKSFPPWRSTAVTKHGGAAPGL